MNISRTSPCVCSPLWLLKEGVCNHKLEGKAEIDQFFSGLFLSFKPNHLSLVLMLVAYFYIPVPHYNIDFSWFNMPHDILDAVIKFLFFIWMVWLGFFQNFWDSINMSKLIKTGHRKIPQGCVARWQQIHIAATVVILLSSHSIQAQHLQKVLVKKRDPVTHISFIDHLSQAKVQ